MGLNSIDSCLLSCQKNRFSIKSFRQCISSAKKIKLTGIKLLNNLLYFVLSNKVSDQSNKIAVFLKIGLSQCANDRWLQSISCLFQIVAKHKTSSYKVTILILRLDIVFFLSRVLPCCEVCFSSWLLSLFGGSVRVCQSMLLYRKCQIHTSPFIPFFGPKGFTK